MFLKNTESQIFIHQAQGEDANTTHKVSSSKIRTQEVQGERANHKTTSFQGEGEGEA